jgi:gliding motility-associated lipoprotein GldH
MKRIIVFIGILTLFIIAGCHWTQKETIYHPFPDHSWDRFQKLTLEIPVKQCDRPVQVILFAWHTKAFPYRALNFHMVMETPSGEERINEFSLKIKNTDGKFLGTFQGDSCEGSIPLKKELYINQDGLLKIELENLIPRMKTEGLLGIGIRVVE